MNQAPEQQQAHPAQVAQEFMRRTDMKGGEVEAYAQTFNWLQGFLAGEIVPTPKEAHLAMTAELEELRTYRRENDEAYAKAQAEAAGEIPVLDPEVDGIELDPVDSEIEQTA